MADQLPSQVPTPAPTIQTTTTTPGPNGTLTKAITDQLFFHTVAAGTEYFLFDDSQAPGALLGFEISTDLPDIIFQIYYYADNPSVVTYVNNFQMHELLSLGRGLTPGEVQILPNGQSQDIMGKSSNVYPWLARFKLDSVPDFTSQFASNSNFNSAAPVIVLRFEPSQPITYQRVVGNIINTNPETDATIITMDIKRVVYQQLQPGDTPPPTPASQGSANVRRTVALPGPSSSSSVYGFKPKMTPSPNDGNDMGYTES